MRFTKTKTQPTKRESLNTTKNMNSSPGRNQATHVWFRACCPNPVFKPPPEPEHQPSRKQMSTSAACRREFVASTASSLFPNAHFTSHESIPTLEESFAKFVKAYPKYSDTARIDRIRAREYSHLSLSNHVCLDYIGVGLFSQSQVKSQYALVVPNPSPSPKPSLPLDFALFGVHFGPAGLKSQLVHGRQGCDLELAMEKRIAEFLNLSMDEYSMVFTANKSAAFQLVAESYPFHTSRKLLTVYDHKSEAVSALVNMAEKRGAHLMEAEFKWPSLRLHSTRLRKMLVRKNSSKKERKRGLFVFPPQSRVSGASYSYQWVKTAQENGWHVLLDACALGPKDMDTFGLSLFRPDFLVCSFYRVFGENPTGFGCLFAKKSIASILESSACGGTVSITPPRNILALPEDSATSTDTEHEINQEDENTSSGVCEKRCCPDIECRSLDHVDSLGLMLVCSRGRYLINWLVSALLKLRHSNRLDNFPLVVIYGPKVKFNRGPALAFNIYDWKGGKVEPVLVQKLADRSNISVGQGFLSGIWFGEKCEDAKRAVLEMTGEEGEEAKGKGPKGGVGIKVVTMALSFLANFEDVYKLWEFVARFLDADFVEKERWRYTAMNEKTMEV